MSTGLSHVTFITADLDRMQTILEEVLGARCLYRSQRQFSKSPERFFMVGTTWVAIMQGEPLPGRSYNHTAFEMADDRLEACETRIRALGLDLLPPRGRVAGEGRSLYFYTPDNHLIELHSGTLAERLAAYAEPDGEQA